MKNNKSLIWKSEIEHGDLIILKELLGIDLKNKVYKYLNAEELEPDIYNKIEGFFKGKKEIKKKWEQGKSIERLCLII